MTHPLLFKFTGARRRVLLFFLFLTPPRRDRERDSRRAVTLEDSSTVFGESEKSLLGGDVDFDLTSIWEIGVDSGMNGDLVGSRLDLWRFHDLVANMLG